MRAITTVYVGSLDEAEPAAAKHFNALFGDRSWRFNEVGPAWVDEQTVGGGVLVWRVEFEAELDPPEGGGQ